MIPREWIAHRRPDGELVGYLVEEVAAASGDTYRPVNVFGHPVGEPTDIVAAMDLLDEVGLGGLADHWWFRRDDGARVRVKIYEATPDHVVVVDDDFGAGGDIGHRTTLPVPAGEWLSPC